MEIKTGAIYRGEGKIYLLCEVEDMPDGCHLSASSHFFDIELPVLVFSNSVVHALPYSNFYILVLFDVVGTQRIDFCVVQGEAEVIYTRQETLNGFIAKWSSRLNGIVKRSGDQLIRNIDNIRFLHSLKMGFRSFFPETNGCWNLVVSLGYEYEADLAFRAFSSKGKEIRCEVAPFNSVNDSKNDNGIREYGLLIKNPDFTNAICVAAYRDGRCVALNTFDRRIQKVLKKEYEQNYMDAAVDPRYQLWLNGHREGYLQFGDHQRDGVSSSTKFSIIVPLYKTPRQFFIEMADSVIRQTYTNWELILVNASPEDDELNQIVADYVVHERRIKAISLERNLGITENTNVGIDAATGDYLCFFDHDDVLEPNLLDEYAKAVKANPQIALLYCDEDKLFPNGMLGQPFFKPDFNLDLLRDNNYICHLLTIKHEMMQRIGRPTREFDGAQDHNMALQVAETGLPIHHVPKVLYHWRMSKSSTASNADSKPYATEAGIRAVQAHCNRVGIDAKAECSHGRAFRYRLRYNTSQLEPATVVFVVNGLDFDAMTDLIGYANRLSNNDSVGEILFIDNDVCLTFTDFSAMNVNAEDSPIARADNWAQMMNRAVERSKSEKVIFITVRGSFCESDCLETLLGILQRDDVAVVTPLICDSTDAVVSAGVSYSFGNMFSMFKGMSKDIPGYVFRLQSTQDVSSASPICFVLNKRAWGALGGFDCEIKDKDLIMADYCFRATDRGYLNVYTPETCFRCEGVIDVTISSEDQVFLSKWKTRIHAVDPYLSPNIAPDPHKASHFALM